MARSQWHLAHLFRISLWQLGCLLHFKSRESPYFCCQFKYAELGFYVWNFTKNAVSTIFNCMKWPFFVWNFVLQFGNSFYRYPHGVCITGGKPRKPIFYMVFLAKSYPQTKRCDFVLVIQLSWHVAFRHKLQVYGASTDNPMNIWGCSCHQDNPINNRCLRRCRECEHEMSANRQRQAKQWQADANESIAKRLSDPSLSERDDRLFRASTRPIVPKATKSSYHKMAAQAERSYHKAVSSRTITRNGFRVFDPMSEMTEESFKSWFPPVNTGLRFICKRWSTESQCASLQAKFLPRKRTSQSRDDLRRIGPSDRYGVGCSREHQTIPYHSKER